MRCFLPFVDELSVAGVRLSKMAHLLGADCVPVPLPRASANPPGDLEKLVTEEAACIAICPEVVRAWLGTDGLRTNLASHLATQFQFVLVHELDVDAGSTNLVRVLSEEAAVCVRTIEDPHCGYQVADEELCGPFSDLKFGPAKKDNRVLELKPGQRSVHSIISIGGRPLFSKMSREGTEVFFLAGVAGEDIEGDFAGRKVPEYFADLLPLAMFLRHAFGDDCWRPANPPTATLIVDDPPLWKKYGFLSYEQLLALMDQFNFHATIAFIPYYWKDSSPLTVRLFRRRPDRFSVCFHGNDHTAGEFASRDPVQLNGLLATARARIESFTAMTGIPCDDVMVFPQGAFSRNAVETLNDNGFVGAVNSGHSPQEKEEPLTFAELVQPSIVKRDGFPLFLRKYVKDIRPEEIALNAFFGKPILIVAHHELFKDVSPLLAVVSAINRMLPDVRWCNVQASLENACLVRRATDGTRWFHPAAKTGRITNRESCVAKCVAEWPATTPLGDAANMIRRDGVERSEIAFGDRGSRTTFEIAPGTSRTVALDRYCRNNVASSPQTPLHRKLSVQLRRRLSELRDNYLSKSPAMLSLAKSVHDAISR